MATYRSYLKEKHPDYLLTGVENRSACGLIGITDIARKRSPLRSLNLFQPFESRNDALHEVAGVFIYPIIYLVTGLVEAALDSAHLLETLFTGLNKGEVPLILFPPAYPVLLVVVAIVTVLDMMVAIFLASGMLAKSAVGLITGGVATAFSATDDFFFGDKEDSPPSQMTNS